MSTYIASSEYTQRVVAALDAARKAGIPALLWGAPGTGKTELVKALATKAGLHMEILLGSTMDPTDLAGLPALQEKKDSEGNVLYSITANTVPDFADNIISAGGGCLFADELNNSTPSVQSGMLSLMQGRMVGRHKLPENTWIVGASNEPEDAADGYDLAGPMANRLFHINWNPPVEDWIEGMIASWNEDVTDAVRDARATITSFIKTYPNLLHVQPKNESEAGKAWPSRRSWDNSAKVLAEAPKDDQTRNMVLAGLIGADTSIQFFKWERALALPSHEEVLNAPEKLDWSDKMRADVALTILSRTAALLNADNADKSINVFRAALDGKKGDIATSLMSVLIRRVNEQGIEKKVFFPLMTEIGPLIAKAGIA